MFAQFLPTHFIDRGVENNSILRKRAAYEAVSGFKISVCCLRSLLVDDVAKILITIMNCTKNDRVSEKKFFQYFQPMVQSVSHAKTNFQRHTFYSVR